MTEEAPAPKDKRCTGECSSMRPADGVDELTMDSAGVDYLLAKWNDMDELTMAGLLILRNVINREIAIRGSYCCMCKNVPPGCNHCYSKIDYT